MPVTASVTAASFCLCKGGCCCCCCWTGMLLGLSHLAMSFSSM
jgi:hypothetical protein